MQQYEAISYNKNFLTGEVVSECKTKQERGVKGKVTVSLFDAVTGEKTQEAHTENLVPELFFKDTFIGAFAKGIMGVGNSRYSSAYDWFGWLYLTDSDKPENNSEHRVMGNVIGFAGRNTTYSGSDTRRGSVNLAETKLDVTDSKMRLNFVFDFPTHCANGITESVYFCEADYDNKDTMYIGAPVYYRENADNDFVIYSDKNPRRYYAAYIAFSYGKCSNFTSPTKGYMILDGKSSTIAQSTYLQFPDALRGHWLYIPFDVNTNDMLLWEQAVRLLNADGNPLIAITTDPVKKYDGLEFACPYTVGSDTFIIGYTTYYVSSKYYIRIYKWSKVGVLLSSVDICTSDYKDAYDTVFNRSSIHGNGIYLDGCIDILGYNTRIDEATAEQVYTSRWIKVSFDGLVMQDMNIKPKLGNCAWFGEKGMNSGNVERRCRISELRRGKSRVYFNYTAAQGGTAFWQCVSPGGNLIEPYRKYFSIQTGNYTYYNILNTDRWVVRYGNTYSTYTQFGISNLLTSRPIGTHTRLTQPVEKTEANTMKVQYLFEIDLLTYGEDYY